MCHLVRRSVLNDTTIVQGLLPRGLLKTKRKIKLLTFSVQNYFPPHHPNCNTFSNVRCSTFPGTSKKTLAGPKPCFVSESFKMEIRSMGRHHIEEGVDDRHSAIKKTSAQQILVPLIFVLNFGDAAPGISKPRPPRGKRTSVAKIVKWDPFSALPLWNCNISSRGKSPHTSQFITKKSSRDFRSESGPGSDTFLLLYPEPCTPVNT